MQRYENGMSKLNVEKMQIISEALSVPLSYFFESYKTGVAEDQSPYLTPMRAGCSDISGRSGTIQIKQPLSMSHVSLHDRTPPRL